MKKSLFQLIRFGIVGSSNTALDIGFYAALTRWVPFFGEFYLFAATLSFLVAGLNSYIWNRRWTFKDGTGIHGVQLLRFYVVQSAIFGMNLLLLWFFVEAGVHDVVAKALAGVSAGLVNFGLQKFWVFRQNSV